MQLTSITPATISGSGSLTRGISPPAAQTAAGAPPSASTSKPAASAGTADTRGPLPGEQVPFQRSVQPASPAPDSGVSASRSGEGRGSERAASQDGGERRSESNGAPPESNRAGSEPGGGVEGRNNQSEPSARQPSGTGNENSGERLSPEERSELRELRSRDLEVRQHEQAHQAVGGQFAGPVSFTFQRGPNGQLFAIGGQVSIDTSPVPDDPEATISKMQVVRAAALAPAEPSPQDIQVAQEATSQMLEARAEMRTQRREEAFQNPESDSGAGGSAGDPRLDLFRSVDGFSTDAGVSENGSRFAAIA